MKKLYWRPPGVSRRAMALIALVALTALFAVERFPVERRQRWYDQKLAAARLAQNCIDAIRSEKLERGIEINREFDPGDTGIVGNSISPVTSNTGYIAAKLTSTNPNFAAVLIHWLKKAELGRGDLVAVGVSGSFPALNVATFASLKTLEANPIVIASSSSSQFGANDPGYMWLDMERTLNDKGLIPFGSIAASPGGIDDRLVGMSKRGRTLLDAAMARADIRIIQSKSLADAIEQRMQIFDEKAEGRPIKAYINVGGGSASVGTHVGKKQFKPGLNSQPPRGPDLADSVMLRFAKRGVPVVHLSRIKLIAEKHGLPYEPKVKVPIGRGNVYVKAEYNPWLALGGIIAIFAAMLAFIRMDVGLRILQSNRQQHKPKRPEPMV